MGKDDLFKKRKRRKAAVLEREKAKKESYARVLIVTEGEKTEPNYLNELIKKHNLSSVNIVVDGECGSDCMSIYRHARKRFDALRASDERFDRVYCVFDRDTHANYSGALNTIQRAEPPGIFHAINSVPCFEYWLLLHYRFTTKQFADYKDVKKDFPRELSDYDKGMTGLYERTEQRLPTAIGNAKRALDHAESSDTDNPTTRVHLLVEYLRQLKT